MNDKKKTYIKRNAYTDKGGEDDIYLGDIDNIQELKDSEEYLTNLKKTNKRQFFKQYCQLFIEVSKKGKITRQTAAHMIAKWMFERKLGAIPEIKEIALLAGSLEVPYHIATDKGDKQAYDKEWDSLIEKIYNLKY